MNAFIGVMVAVGVGLLTNELFDASSWLAKRIVRRAARIKYGDSERGAIRAEEQARYIADRPGNLLKLVTAIGFFATALAHRRQRAAGDDAPQGSLLDQVRAPYLVDIPSGIVARGLYPTERYEGEWVRHWWAPTRRIILGTLGCLALTLWPPPPVSTGLGPDWLASGLNAVIAARWPWWILLAPWAGWSITAWWRDRFTVTRSRVMRVRGVLRFEITSASLSSATDVQLRQSILGRVLNYGTITFLNLPLLHPMRRTTALPNPNELLLQVAEVIYDPAAIYERETADEELIATAFGEEPGDDQLPEQA
jgi:hypothetical protein